MIFGCNEAGKVVQCTITNTTNGKFPSFSQRELLPLRLEMGKWDFLHQKKQISTFLAFNFSKYLEN